MQVPCLKRKTNMLAGAQGDTPEVGGRYLNILRDTYSDTTNVKYTLSCTRPSKVIVKEVGYRTFGRHGAARGRRFGKVHELFTLSALSSKTSQQPLG